MDKPLQLININKDGVCSLNPQAEEIINTIEDNLAVICVAGLYRTGKSYLMNRLLNRQDGFEIGPTINSCTKGLWIWGEPLTLKDKGLKVLLIDTEGLGSAFEDRNETIDMEIFCLGVLLSSLFIYNSMKVIDENAVENLGLVINFAKKIYSKFSNLENYSNNFPSFMWVLRDFALELIDSNGKKITSNTYLENALRYDEITEDTPDDIKKKNDIRKLLKVFFKERECITLVRPVSDEKKLRNIDKLDKNELRPEFINQMDTLCSKIFAQIRSKLVEGSYIDGKMFINLIKMYIESLNSNSIPDVKTSWKIVIDAQISHIYDKSLEYYIDEMLSIDYKKINKIDELIGYHNEHKSIALEYLKEFHNINVPITLILEMIKKLEIKINEQFLEIVSKWEELSKNQCEIIGNDIIKEYKNNNAENDVMTCLDLIEEVFKYIDQNINNNKKYEVIYPQMLTFFIDLLKKGFREQNLKFESEKNSLLHENESLKNMIEKTKNNLENVRNEYDGKITEIKNQNMQSRLDFEAKIDERNKIIKNEQKEHEAIIDQLKEKIDVLNDALNEEKQLKKVEKTKNKTKVKNLDEGLLDMKYETIIDRLNNFKDAFIKNEINNAKTQIKLEVNNKIEDIETELVKKINQAKKMSDKTVTKLKNAHNEEIQQLKQMIKELYDEINDYKIQTNSQEYKIDLYKEKIITYEKEKKSQTDHAELLRVLTTKLQELIAKNLQKK